MKSTEQWVNYAIRLWDILAELVRMNTSPTPPNPFSIDINYFKSLDGARVQIYCLRVLYPEMVALPWHLLYPEPDITSSNVDCIPGNEGQVCSNFGA